MKSSDTHAELWFSFNSIFAEQHDNVVLYSDPDVDNTSAPLGEIFIDSSCEDEIAWFCSEIMLKLHRQHVKRLMLFIYTTISR